MIDWDGLEAEAVSAALSGITFADRVSLILDMDGEPEIQIARRDDAEAMAPAQVTLFSAHDLPDPLTVDTAETFVGNIDLRAAYRRLTGGGNDPHRARPRRPGRP